MEFKNSAGVARLVEGQYRGSHTLGLHQGKYEALRQQKPVKVYRDKNKDMNFDEDVIQEGIFGINIHKAGADSTYVENWSEGCQVFKKSADFEEFMSICRKAAAIHGKSFTYTLINSKEII
jgi:putative heme degradation protein